MLQDLRALMCKFYLRLTYMARFFKSVKFKFKYVAVNFLQLVLRVYVIPKHMKFQDGNSL